VRAFGLIDAPPMLRSFLLLVDESKNLSLFFWHIFLSHIFLSNQRSSDRKMWDRKIYQKNWGEDFGIHPLAFALSVWKSSEPLLSSVLLRPIIFTFIFRRHLYEFNRF
jgi:hypothetical protein